MTCMPHERMPGDRPPGRKPRSDGGFTLVELLIVVAIVGILALVAVPAYQDSVIKGRRADARVALNQLAQRLERCYTQYGAYDADECDIESPFDSPEGFYSVSFVADATSYTVTAEPQGAQVKDVKCGTLGLTSLGERLVDYDGENEGPDADENRCW
jgi:type IV pilus assembly protein PilE